MLATLARTGQFVHVPAAARQAQITDSTGTATCHSPGFQQVKVVLQGFTYTSAATTDFNSVSKLQH